MLKIYVITGLTAVGKTDYAINFAEKFNAEIVSCDSLAVYKHADIGTAKPTASDMLRVRHHCIDLVEPDEKFDVSKYMAAAENAIALIFAKKKNVVVVGGSGFYLKSFYFPVIDDVKIPVEVEAFVNSGYAAAGLDWAVSLLISVNDGICPSIDVKNPRRVLSALKRCLSSGKTFSDVVKSFQERCSPFSNYDIWTILLERNREDLEKRICERAKKMIAVGFIEEAKFLQKKYKTLNPSITEAIGYRETFEWLQNPTTQSKLADAIVCSTLKLVKKQDTWLKKQIPVDEKIFLV